ncbi:hypothetical protein GN956_G11864 [Arapaima gigas]
MLAVVSSGPYACSRRRVQERRCPAGPWRHGEETPLTRHCFFMTNLSGETAALVSPLLISAAAGSTTP